MARICWWHTAQKIKFSIKDFFSKCDQIRGFLRIWSYLLKKSLTENFIFCEVAFCKLRCLRFCVSSDKWKTTVAMILLAIWDTFLCKSNCNFNSCKFSYKLYLSFICSFLMNHEQESHFKKIGGLVTKNMPVFVYSKSRSTLKACWIQKTFIIAFLHVLFLSIYSFMVLVKEKKQCEMQGKFYLPHVLPFSMY